MDRAKCLDLAKKIVEQDRQNSYGKPENNFAQIAEYWNIYLASKKVNAFEKIEPIDVANMMILLKIARTKANPYYLDNYIDIAGYAACGFEIASNGCKKENED